MPDDVETEEVEATPDDDEVIAAADNPDAVRNALKRERDAAKAERKKAEDLASRIRELEDRDKTETEKLGERASTAERRAEEAELRALRFEVAAAKGVPLQQAHRLAGGTREELERDADEFLASLTPATVPDFDGGARQSAPTGDMDALIRRTAGRR
jgi:hypothetical protein